MTHGANNGTTARLLRGGVAPLLVSGCLDYGIEGIRNINTTADGGIAYGEELTVEMDGHPCGDGDQLARAVTYSETCLQQVETGLLDAEVEWSVSTFASGYGEYGEVLMAPVVGQLDDDDGDGDVDRDDVPDIVVVSDDGGANDQHGGVIRIIPGDGETGASSIQRVDVGELQVYPYRYSNVALGDVDADGEPEIVAMVLAMQSGGGGDPEDTGGGSGIDTGTPGGGDDSGGPPDDEEDDHPVRRSGTVGDAEVDMGETCLVAAYDPRDLSVEWVATDILVDCAGHAPALADLEGDGEVEVVVGPWILEGADGTVRAHGEAGQGRYYAYAEIGMHSVVADLDLDGVQEIVAGNTLYDPQGQVVCDASVNDGFAAVADLDGDGAGDVVVVGGGEVAVLDHRCGIEHEWTLSGGGNGGPPTIGDFDGDGEPEVGIADATVYATYEPDGTLIWSAPITDESSHATGSVIFDFEGDGRPEVVYADETRLWVYDGATGDVRLEDLRHASRTLHEYPTVADVDGDGQAEIVVPNGGGHQGEGLTGLYVLGSASGSWLSARQVWNQHAYAITNVDDDLGIPALPDANWPTHNNFRSGDPHPASGGDAPDAVPLAELCELECGAGRHILTVRLGNSGASALRDGVPVSVYTGRDASVLLATDWWTETVQPGEVSDRLRFTIADEDVKHDVLHVKVDDEGGVEWVRECDEDNNTLVIEDVECP